MTDAYTAAVCLALLMKRVSTLSYPPQIEVLVKLLVVFKLDMTRQLLRQKQEIIKVQYIRITIAACNIKKKP